jgi:hypothetical protein
MGQALDGRPLLVRLQKRIEKYTGCLASPLATDVALHQQSVELINELAWALKQTRENLRACQATIHLCGGFDPAYVNDAQAAMKIADAALAKATQ